MPKLRIYAYHCIRAYNLKHLNSKIFKHNKSSQFTLQKLHFKHAITVIIRVLMTGLPKLQFFYAVLYFTSCNIIYIALLRSRIEKLPHYTIATTKHWISQLTSM